MNNSEDLKAAVEAAQTRFRTDGLLRDLKKVGYQRVWIETYHPHGTLPGIVAEPRVRIPNTHWEVGDLALWKIIDKHGGMGCGNGLNKADQCQARLRFTRGEYDLTTWEPTYVDPEEG